jgi:hypothetical protein
MIMATSKAKASKPAKASKSIASKPDAATIAQATTPKPTIEMYGLGSTPYATLESNRKAYAAWIIALGLTSGLLRVSGDGVTGTGTGKMECLKKHCGSAFGYWKTTKGRIDDKGFTAEGLNEISARLKGLSKGYNTTMAIVAEAQLAQKLGGTRKINGLEVKMALKPSTY